MDGLILELSGVAFRYPGTAADALSGVTLAVRRGEVQGVLGPNGSGKTTLVRVALGAHAAREGTAMLLGKPIAAWSLGELARTVGVVPQREDFVFPQRVRDTVALGRYPHLSAWRAARDADRQAISRALERCDLSALADRWVSTLSGGEYQRVRIARALAQEPQLLVLDEPTASLDLRHEMELFELARSLADEHALGVLVITHHVNLAARYADRVLVLSRGRPVAAGPPDVLTRAVIEEVFAWPVQIELFEGRPQAIPLRRGKDGA
ncbi:MAG TPA: ABC transporter ATP-binding protein [Gemmatimonadales bacterium]|nr:ABC transporter ATP-binding protein [Gemmatimonadales bacterium]